MANATELQALLRFLSQDAKVSLATAMGKVKELQAANISSVESIAKSNVSDIQKIFEEEKLSKQILTAAKRVSKKRASGDTSSAPSRKKAKPASDEPLSPEELEESLALPDSDATEEQLAEMAFITNRAPLVLAFAVTLLKYTMPEQPLSSRLSLAQAYVSTSSKSRAIYLGIDKGKTAKEEGYGEGQPVVKVMGKEIKAMKRWGYDWRAKESPAKDGKAKADEEEPANDEPALWGVDLEALKKADTATGPASAGLPIHTPQSARAYLIKSFESVKPSSPEAPKKKITKATTMAEKERNLGHLLKALEILYMSWAEVLDADELDKRTWPWYAKVRPAVEDGAAGWGGRNKLKLADILELANTK